MKPIYDCAIVGAGVTGTAILYILSRYTNLKNIALIEKYGSIASVSSDSKSNSQTLHFGDIETNYSLDKAKVVKEAAEMVKRYVDDKNNPELFRKSYKMVLAVGAKEVLELRARYEEFKTLFPNLKLLQKNEIADIEPNLIKGRDPKEPILALWSHDGYAINYQKLSEAFVSDAKSCGKNIDVLLNTAINSIRKNADGNFTMRNGNKTLVAKTVIVAAGPYSLLFAQELGIGLDYGILPVVGNFYTSKNFLNGKVYTMQIKGIPFAAIHGDADVENPEETRFGPTAKALPLFEKKKYRTFFDFLKSSVASVAGIVSLVKVVADKTIVKFISKNALYDIPLIGKWFFLKEAQKIVPSLKYSDIKFGKNLGGLRPQIVNLKTRTLELGEAKLNGENIIFNITPSPGASVCLKNAEKDAKKIVAFLGPEFNFDTEKFEKDFHPDR